MKEITYAQAVCEAIDEEMERDDSVMLLGEDVAFIGGNFKTSVGLLEKYGPMRVRDTPIAEQGFVGMALGMALTGMRPIVELMFSDFLLVAADQVFNQIAKIRYMSGGQACAPVVIRAPMGAGRSSAAQHSQSMQAMSAQFPGIKVVVPSTAQELKGLMKTAVRDDDPVILFEHKMEYNKKYQIDDNVEPIPFGQARIVREGTDVTIVATSSLVMKAEDAAKKLEKEGISVEIIDPRTIVPFDRDAVIKSVQKTGRLIVADESHERCGVAGEIGMDLMDDLFYYLDAPIGRVATPNVPLPFSPALEFPMIPSVDKIYAKVKEIVAK